MTRRWLWILGSRFASPRMAILARYEFIAVYIMASQRNGTLYVGVTSDLMKRAHEHREGLIDGFTRKYGCKLLVWFEQHEQMHTALTREKELKVFRRAWKLNLIERANPQWRDLYEDFINPLGMRSRASC